MRETSEETGAAHQARSLGCRVDYLTIAFAVELPDETTHLLRQRSAHAREHGGNSVELVIERVERVEHADEKGTKSIESVTHSLIAELRPSRDANVDRWSIRNGDLRGKIGVREPGGWTIELHVRAAYLATHELAEAIELCERAAAALGPVRARRVRRVDLCADYAGFPLTGDLSERWMIPRRGRCGDFRGEIDDLDDLGFLSERRTFRDAIGAVTGFTICAGGVCSARVYDKTAELQLSGREEKRAIERARWSSHGWDVDAPEQVTRVEYQLRGEALDDLDLRDPYADKHGNRRALADTLDPIWRYLTRRWLRLLALSRVELLAEGPRRRRADRIPLDPAWQVVQETTFVHEHAKVAIRCRRRGGATHEQALGAALSALAGAGRLPRIAIPFGATEAKPTAERPKEFAISWVTSLMLDAYLTLAMEQAGHFVEQHGPHGAATMVATRWNAVWARFRSGDDQGMAPRWTVDGIDDAGRWVIRQEKSIGAVPSRDGLPYEDRAERAAIERES
jgi:hypothetical protein